MRFIVDECTGPKVAEWLNQNGHNVLSLFDDMPGIADTDILRIANVENRIIITNGKDFGEMIFKNGLNHHGIVLLRLESERFQNKIDVIKNLIENHLQDLLNRFTVVTEKNIRIV